MRLGIVGTGHVGLVSCATFASIGHDVVGYDVDAERIEGLKAGLMPFFEPGLAELVTEQKAAGRLSFTIAMAEVVEGADVMFICVGTPPRASGEANLIAVEQSAQAIARHATGPLVIAEKSTVPAGTAARLMRTVDRERPDLAGQIQIASNPEFLREGKAIEDSLQPDRVLIGASSEAAFEKLRGVYEPLTDKGIKLVETSIESAEIAKHACNAFLALKISYMNAVAQVCDLAGGNVEDVAEVMGSDPRIGPAFLKAGLGYGGSCFPKDILAFGRLSARLGYNFSLLSEIEQINNGAIEAAMAKITEALWNLDGKRIALLGLSFKPGTDDIRFAPALFLAQRLIAEGADVVGYDPHAGGNAKSELDGLHIAPDPYEAAKGAHCAVVCTEWDEIRSLDLAKLKEMLEYPVVIDGRNVFDLAEMAAAGFTYHSVGRPSVS